MVVSVHHEYAVGDLVEITQWIAHPLEAPCYAVMVGKVIRTAEGRTYPFLVPLWIAPQVMWKDYGDSFFDRWCWRAPRESSRYTAPVDSNDLIRPSRIEDWPDEAVRQLTAWRMTGGPYAA